MPKHAETRHLPYSREQMFDLVANVRAYAEFLPWVQAIRVRADGEHEMIADMIVGFKGLRETFTSRVRKSRPDSVNVEYVDGPLAYLRNDWTFREDGQGGCYVDFAVDFAFKSRMFEMLAGQVFDRALRKMIGAFEDRARVLYGSSSTASSESGSSSSSAHSAA